MAAVMNQRQHDDLNQQRSEQARRTFPGEAPGGLGGIRIRRSPSAAVPVSHHRIDRLAKSTGSIDSGSLHFLYRVATQLSVVLRNLPGETRTLFVI